MTLSELPRQPVLDPRMLCRSAAVSNGGEYFVWTSSGRAAIFLALRSFGIGRDSRVLVPTYHCPSMIAPTLAAEAQPLFYPLGADRQPDLDWIRAADTSAVRAVLAAQLFGLPLDLSALRALCDERGWILIEDCAHSFFGALDGKQIGTYGHAVVVSLTKFFPVREGGGLIIKSDGAQIPSLGSRDWRAEVRAFIDSVETAAVRGSFGAVSVMVNAPFRIKRAMRRNRRPLNNSRQEVEQGFALDLTLAERSALCWTRWIVEHSHLMRIAEARRSNYARYTAALEDLPGQAAIAPKLPPEAVPYVFPLHLSNAEGAYHALRSSGAPVYRWDRRFPHTPHIDGDPGWAWASELIQLSCHQDLRAEHIDAIAATIRNAQHGTYQVS